MAERDELPDDDRDARSNRYRDDDDRDRPRERSRRTGISPLVIGLIAGAIFLPLLCVVAVVIGLLLPAVSKVREAAGRMKEQNNLKQMTLAMHNDADMTDGRFFAPYAHDDSGTLYTGLSFRVSILPYMEQGALHQSFDLKQAWDSPRNAAPSNTIVPSYQSVSNPEGVNVPYRVFVGGGALFNEDGRPVPLVSITDGTANTIMFIYAAETVPWAKPQELKYGRGIPLPKLGHPSMTAGIPVAFADGSVRMMKVNESEQTIRSLIEKADGAALNLDW